MNQVMLIAVGQRQKTHVEVNTWKEVPVEEGKPVKEVCRAKFVSDLGPEGQRQVEHILLNGFLV